MYFVPTFFYQILYFERKVALLQVYNSNEILKSLMVDYLMKLSKVHLFNLSLINNIVKEIFPEICQLIDILNSMVKIFNDYNFFLHLKTIHVETNAGYFIHVEEDFRNLSIKYLGAILDDGFDLVVLEEFRAKNT